MPSLLKKLDQSSEVRKKIKSHLSWRKNAVRELEGVAVVRQGIAERDELVETSFEDPWTLPKYEFRAIFGIGEGTRKEIRWKSGRAGQKKRREGKGSEEKHAGGSRRR